MRSHLVVLLSKLIFGAENLCAVICAFSILYEKTLPTINNGEKAKFFEIKVFSRDPLNRMIEEKIFVTFSPHDFSVCYPIGKKNDN